MTKLYAGPGTWQVPGKQDKGAQRVDVPSNPDELATWLNARHVSPEVVTDEPLELGTFTAEGLGDEQPWIMGPAAKDPPRHSLSFLADVHSGAEFIPVTKAAEIDRLLARCPMCHNTEEAAQRRRDRLDFDGVRAWIAERATAFELDELADVVEEKRQ